MSEVKIQTIMTLSESSQAEGSDIRVQMALDTGTETLWTREMHPRRIDVIDVEFKDEPMTDKIGNITLRISLLNGAKFVKPYLSESKSASDDVTKIPCVNFKPQQKNTTLEVDFEQPPKGKEFNYPEMFFHTTSGVVDPILRIKRR